VIKINTTKSKNNLYKDINKYHTLFTRAKAYEDNEIVTCLFKKPKHPSKVYASKFKTNYEEYYKSGGKKSYSLLDRLYSKLTKQKFNYQYDNNWKRIK